MSDYCMSESWWAPQIVGSNIEFTFKHIHVGSIYTYTCTACTIKRKHNLGVDATYWVYNVYIFLEMLTVDLSGLNQS